MASLHPTHGARITLERESGEPGQARFAVQLHEPDEVLRTGRLVIEEAVRLEWSGEAPAAWVHVFIERLAKGLRTKHAADGSWPRRVRRWRAER